MATQQSNLLTVPREIRRHVYKCTFEDATVDIRAIEPGIRRACRTTRAESEEHFYEDSPSFYVRIWQGNTKSVIEWLNTVDDSLLRKIKVLRLIPDCAGHKEYGTLVGNDFDVFFVTNDPDGNRLGFEDCELQEGWTELIKALRQAGFDHTRVVVEFNKIWCNESDWAYMDSSCWEDEVCSEELWQMTFEESFMKALGRSPNTREIDWVWYGIYYRDMMMSSTYKVLTEQGWPVDRYDEDRDGWVYRKLGN